MQKTIAFIPARGGSTSIKLKNIKLFYGKPLIQWNIEALLKIDEIDEIIIATDSKEIAKVVKEQNQDHRLKIYWRKPENAENSSSTESVMLEYLDVALLEPKDIFILVQATSPFTLSQHYKEGIQLFKNSDLKYDSILGCVPFKHPVWSKQGKALTFDPTNRTRRQDFEGCYLENGAFYVNSVAGVLKDQNRLSGKVGFIEMPEYSALEMDEPLDWKIGEMVMEEVKSGNLA